MERFGGVRNPRSGARWDRKNDGRTDTELVEFKRTDNRRSITLLFTDLRDLYNHAVAESRCPVLVFELGGREWVVLPEPDYHELVLHRPGPGAPSDLREDLAPVARSRQVQRATRKPVLLRPSAQQHPGAGGKVGMSRDAPRAPRCLPSPPGVPRLRNRERGAVGRLGRNQRKGTSPDQTPEAS